MPQAACWQDYPPDCCSAAYTTIIIIRYLIHFSGDLKYLGAASTPVTHLPHSSTDLMHLYRRLSISLNVQRIPVGFPGFITLFPPPSRWLWTWEYDNICLLLPSPAPSVLNIAFVHTEEKAAEWKSHSASAAPKMPNVRVKAAVGRKQSVQARARTLC